MTEKLLSIPQAADFLGCSIDQIRKLNVAGDLPAIDIGVGNRRRCLRIDEAELQAFLRRRSSKPATKSQRRKPAAKANRDWV